MAYSSVQFQGDASYNVRCKALPNIGEDVKFSRPMYVGVFPNRRFTGFEVLSGHVVASSYGEKTNRHTFTILTEAGKRLVQARTLLKFGAWRREVFI